MSLWMLQSEDHANQPISFEQLAALLADEAVHEWDLVRSADGFEWQSVDSVIGLCRAAGRIRSERTLRNAGAQTEAQGRTAESAKSADESLRLEAGEVPHPRESGTGNSQVAEAKVRATAGEPTIDPGVSMPMLTLTSRAVPPTLAVVAGICVVGIIWLVWSMWQQSRRFPIPAHLQQQSQPWVVPLLGPVSGFEMSLLGFDAVAVLLFVTWWLRGHRRGRK